MKQYTWRKKFLCLLCAFSLALPTTGCKQVENTVKKVETISVDKKEEQKKFNKFLKKLFVKEVQSDSITLNYTLSKPEDYGIKDYKPTLGKYGTDVSKEERVFAENIYEQLNSFCYNALSEEQQKTYDILADYYKTDKDDEQFLLYGEALGKTTGIQAQLPILLSEYNFYDKDDISDYLELLACVPDYFSQIEDYEKEKSKAGLFMSDKNADNIISQCQDFIDDPENNYLLDVFNDRIDKFEGLSDKERDTFKNQNKKAVLESVIPSYEHLIKTLKKLKGTGKNDGGVCNFKNGKTYYEKLAQSITGSSKNIKEMKQALSQTKNNALLKISTLTKNDPDVSNDYFNKKFPLTDPEKIISDLQNKIKDDFPELEPVNCDIKYVHKSLEDHLSPAFYLTPPIDNYKENSIYINRGNNANLDEIYPTLAHEGYPGHLFQNVYFNQQNPTPIRSLLNYGGYSEGWATYCELYSYQFSGLEDNTAEFGKQYNIFTLCLYAEMDIGVNYDGWTLDKLSTFLSSYGVTDKDAAQEVYDIVVDDPANYLQYVIGYIEFAELRTKAENTLKKSFSPKAFHTFLLDMGPAPFSVIGDYMEKWMDEQ